MGEIREAQFVRLRALAAAARESQKIAADDILTRNLEIAKVYDTDEWTLKDLSEATGLSIPQVHKAIRKVSERD